LKRRIEFHEFARDEYIAAARWYEDRQEGLGREFADAIESLVERAAMDACGNRFAIPRSRPQAYYYAQEKGERSGTPKPSSPPRCVNHVPGLFCKQSPRLLS